MGIEIRDESGFPGLNQEEMGQLAEYVFAKMGVHPRAELFIRLVDEKAMEELHIQWMDEPGPTDVLSFPMDELRPPPLGEPPVEGILGDIVVCPSVAARQAIEHSVSTADEILLLITHGILHLLGYDHVEPEEREEMFGLQRELLLTFLAQRPEGSHALPPDYGLAKGGDAQA